MAQHKPVKGVIAPPPRLTKTALTLIASAVSVPVFVVLELVF